MNKSEWISVNDIFPEENVPVLILCKGGSIFVSERDVLRWPNGEEMHWIVRGPLGSGRRIATSRITHWMPLPKPPKE